MNRDHKYRAWDKKRKRMYEVIHLHLSSEGIWATVKGFDIIEQKDIHLQIQPKDIEVMDYTTLQDKNGKDIYEGDILMDQYQDKNYDLDREDDSPITVKIYYPVVFKDGCLGWIGEITGEFFNFYDHPVPETQIVGNVYESPELINPPSKEL